MNALNPAGTGSLVLSGSGGSALQGVELRHLRYFVAVADAGTFTRAAERIYIAQPTLSQQIRRLEEMVGTPLFRRRREGVGLTEAGRVLLEESRTAGAARRRGGRCQHGLLLGHDLLGAAGAAAARGGGGQSGLHRGGEHAARRRCPGHGGQLGDDVQLGHRHSRLRVPHPCVGHLERLRAPGPAHPRAAGADDGCPARCCPDRGRGRGPGIARRHGRRPRPDPAQCVFHASRGPGAAARTRDRQPDGTAAAALPSAPDHCSASATGPPP